MKLKRIFAAVTAFALCASLAGCGAATTVSESAAESAAESAVESTPAVTEAPATEETADASEAALRIAGLKGPTTMGLVNLMSDEVASNYNFTMYGAADEIVPLLVKGDLDAARCAKRMGAEHVYVLYRRDEEEMPARKEEVHHAKEEGIEFMLLTNPVKVLDDGTGRVGGLECVKMRLTAPDESGRRAPKVVEGSNFTLEVDTVVMSLGTSPNPLIRSTTPGLETNRKGCLQVDEETMATSRPGVYAGGDAVTGAATVILAMGAGKKAAESMHQYLQEKHSK